MIFLLTAEQCRGARAMLGWSRQELARVAKVAVGTIVDFERKARRPYDRTLLDIRRAFENAGIEFIESNNGGPGLRLNRRTSD